MPNFDSNDPREFGWSLSFRGFVPFVYHGHSFPQGVHPAVVGVFTRALDRLTSSGLVLAPLSMGLAAGMWGQEDRTIKGGSTPSFHAYGLAIDVNAPWNGWGVTNPAPSPYRLADNTSALVEPLGILWGGSVRFGDRPDRMHLECHMSPAELGRPTPPTLPPPRGGLRFPLPAGYYYGPLSGPTTSISGAGPADGPYRPGLETAQRRLGTTADGLYGPLTALAARTWQRRHGLQDDGLIGVLTWTSLFP